MKDFDAIINYIDLCLNDIPTCFPTLSGPERANLELRFMKIKKKILNAIAQLKMDIGEDINALNALRTLKKYI